MPPTPSLQHRGFPGAVLHFAEVVTVSGTVGTTASALSDLIDEPSCHAIRITNNHASNTLFVGPDEDLLNADFYEVSISPGASYSPNYGNDILKQLFVMGSAASTVFLVQAFV